MLFHRPGCSCRPEAKVVTGLGTIRKVNYRPEHFHGFLRMGVASFLVGGGTGRFPCGCMCRKWLVGREMRATATNHGIGRNDEKGARSAHRLFPVEDNQSSCGKYCACVSRLLKRWLSMSSLKKIEKMNLLLLLFFWGGGKFHQILS